MTAPATSSPESRWPMGVDPFEAAPPLPEQTLRLAFNESPLGPFRTALEALAAHPELIGRYPEGDGELAARLEAVHGLAPGSVLLGNGGDAIIGYLSQTYLRPGDEVITAWPSFPTYVIDAIKQGASVIRVPLAADGACDLTAMAAAISPRTRLVWVCTPNNPTGAAVSADALRAFLDVVDERVLVVVDEAYFEFCAPGSVADTVTEHVPVRPNVAALRTFSKLYGLAGLRVGWLAGPGPVIAAAGGARHYYDVTGPAALAALASLDDGEEVARRRADNARLRERLADALAARGYRSGPSQTNFLAVEVDDADALAARLLATGIATRSLSALGCPQRLRVTVGDDAGVARLLAALDAL